VVITTTTIAAAAATTFSYPMNQLPLTIKGDVSNILTFDYEDGKFWVGGKSC
jgi:hypothetical protein